MRRTVGTLPLVTLVVASGIAVACRTTNSELRDDTGGADLETLYADIRSAMSAAGCEDCHSDVNNGGLNQWALDTKRQVENLRSEEPAPRGSGTGVYVPDASRIKGIHKAYPEYFQGYFSDPAVFKKFAKDIRAPGMKVSDALESGVAQEQLFMNLQAAIMKLADRNATTQSLGCANGISDDLKKHIVRMESTGWAAKLLTGDQAGAEFKMFGCTDSVDATQCLNNPAQWPLRQELINADVGVPGVRMIQIADVGDTSYWMRSSPDGRFVGNGGGDGAHIDDLANKIRYQIDSKSYDPGFFADNRGWTFHGGEVVFCRMQTLDPQLQQNAAALARAEAPVRDPRTSRRRRGARENRAFERPSDMVNIGGQQWRQVFLDPAAGPNQQLCTGGPAGNDAISTYQSVAAAESAKAYVVTGSHSTDPGSPRPDDISFSGEMLVYEMSNGDKFSVPGTPTAFQLPNEGDYSLTPSGSYVVGRVAGQKEGGAESVQLGYRLRSLTNMMANPAGFNAADDKSMSSICIGGSGSKPMASLDERFITFHQYTGGYEDGGKSDIFIVDLLQDGKVFKVTNVPPGYKAVFPHFLANNMLYFLMHTPDSEGGIVMATDVAAIVAQ